MKLIIVVCLFMNIDNVHELADGSKLYQQCLHWQRLPSPLGGRLRWMSGRGSLVLVGLVLFVVWIFDL